MTRIFTNRIDQPIEKFYDLVDKSSEKEEINILFVTGIEYSLYEYEDLKKRSSWESLDIYN
ncbi:MAG: hypothetical protein AB4426_10720 [Xenococcaceae cyanobacterium]